jgi:hypothetical protein
MPASLGSGFVFTKEKLVFGVALLVSLASFTGVRKPVTEDLPKIPPEEAPHPPRVTVPVPSVHPEKGLDPNARDPFVPASQWAAATPARLGALPDPAAPRVLPTGARGAVVTLDKDPKPIEEADPVEPQKKEDEKK